MILISNDFWQKIKMYYFDPYNVLLSITTNIAVLLMTVSVLQRHIYISYLFLLPKYIHVGVYIYIYNYVYNLYTIKVVGLFYFIIHRLYYKCCLLHLYVFAKYI